MRLRTESGRHARLAAEAVLVAPERAEQAPPVRRARSTTRCSSRHAGVPNDGFFTVAAIPTAIAHSLEESTEVDWKNVALVACCIRCFA